MLFQEQRTAAVFQENALLLGFDRVRNTVEAVLVGENQKQSHLD
jgi:hypothetical protein